MNSNIENNSTKITSVSPMTPPICRTERFVNNSMITVVSDSRDSSQFLRQIASLKNVQSDNEPFFVMDIGSVNDLIDQWSKALPRVYPYYSVRCNNNPVLLKVLTDNSCVNLNCQTPEELETALQIVSPQRIFYNNPCLTRSSLRSACSTDVSFLGFSSARDLTRILQNHPNADLMLNISINADIDSLNFGCDISEAAELLRLAHELNGNCVGVSFDLRGGGKNTSIEVYTRAIEQVAELFEFGQRCRMNLNCLNIGGGFSNDCHFFEKLALQINSALNYYLPIDHFPELRIIAIPGRFFASTAFSLATKIMARRSVDASMVTNDDFDSGNEAFIYQTNEGYYGSFGCRIDEQCEPECTPLFEHYLDNVTSKHIYASVVGPQDDSFDIVQSLCRFRPLGVGDWLLWRNMGAYSLNNTSTLDDESNEAFMEEAYNGDSPISNSPAIFYFASHENWTKVERRNENITIQKKHSGAASPLSDGSCGMVDDCASLLDPDDLCDKDYINNCEELNNYTKSDEEEEEGQLERYSDFWMFHWLLNDY